MTSKHHANLLSSMTGFARVTGSHDMMNWAWEARSVNGKTLDMRVRLPSELSMLDGPVRKKTSAVFTRGNIQISLNHQHGETDKSYRINTTLLAQLQKSGADNLSALMSVPGVVEEIEILDILSEPSALENYEKALLESFDQIIEKLDMARRSEGEALVPLLSGAVDQIERFLTQARKTAKDLPQILHGRVVEKLSILKGEGFSPDRLGQEAAVFVMKADVREELDRLDAHCDQARTLLAKGSPVGRKLDFLSQEFNREVNTLCAKSADIELTRIGLELKSVIEQFREQAANVE